MTEQEAKKRLEVWLKCGECPEDKRCYDSYLHSICEYTDYCDEVSIVEAVKVAIEALKQELCEDAISRAEAISRIEVRRKITCESDPYNYYEEWTKGYEAGIDDAITMINSVSPVTPQPKMGHWINKDDKSAVCPFCNRNNTLYGDYCKWCGKKVGLEHNTNWQ